MYFDTFAEFVDMGGHGFFVWSCYAIVLVVLVGNILQPMRETRKFQLALKRTLVHQGDVTNNNQNDKETKSAVTQVD